MTWLIPLLLGLGTGTLLASNLAEQFVAPPASAQPWVYWYFMDGNLDRAGMKSGLLGLVTIQTTPIVPLP